MVYTLQSTRQLHDGIEIPILGFGTYELEGDAVKQPLRWALETGYRHVDSATWYYNEKQCGDTIRQFMKDADVPRKDIFYTTKLMTNVSYEDTLEKIEASLEACGLEHIDLYLLHSAIGGPKKRQECWRACIEAKRLGKVRSIGVSNYGGVHLQEMLDQGVELPTINQVDLHPFMTRIDIVSICQKHNIALEAWGPLVRGLRFRHPSITGLAKKYNKQPAQVLLRYSIQNGFIPIPKASSKERIIANTQIYDFELTKEEMAHLESLDEALVTDWEVTTCP